MYRGRWSPGSWCLQVNYFVWCTKDAYLVDWKGEITLQSARYCSCVKMFAEKTMCLLSNSKGAELHLTTWTHSFSTEFIFTSFHIKKRDSFQISLSRFSRLRSADVWQVNEHGDLKSCATLRWCQTGGTRRGADSSHSSNSVLSYFHLLRLPVHQTHSRSRSRCQLSARLTSQLQFRLFVTLFYSTSAFKNINKSNLLRSFFSKF